MKISILVPVRNEAGIIKRNILILEEFLEKQYLAHEIVVSEDGSTDGTDKILGSIKSRNLIFLHSDTGLGKGKAINNAFLSSSGEKIFLMDADMPMDIRDIPKMINLLDRYDIVIGSRLKRGANVRRSGIRTMTSVAYNTVVRLLFNTSIRDHQCGIKAFRRDALKEILPQMASRGFFWDTEFIVRAKRNNYSIFEMPIKWEERKKEKSKVSVYKESYRMTKNLLKLWYRINFCGKS